MKVPKILKGSLTLTLALFLGLTLSSPIHAGVLDTASHESTQAKRPGPQLKVVFTGLPPGTRVPINIRDRASSTVGFTVMATDGRSIRLPAPGRYGWSTGDVTVGSTTYDVLQGWGTFTARPGTTTTIRLTFVALAKPPGPPTDVTVIPRFQDAWIQWKAPSDTGDLPIIGYEVMAYLPGSEFPDPDLTYTLALDPTAPVQSEFKVWVSGYTKSGTYVIRVTALSSEATSVPSEPSEPVKLGPNNLDFCTPYTLDNGLVLQFTDMELKTWEWNPRDYATFGYMITNPSSEPVDFGVFWVAYSNGGPAVALGSPADILPGEVYTGRSTMMEYGARGVPTWLAYSAYRLQYPRGGATPYWKAPTVFTPGDRRFTC